MSRKKQSGKNLKLAALFILLVLGLIFLSAFIKAIFIINNSRFDGIHRFTVGFQGKNETMVVSFAPLNKSMSILDLDRNTEKENLTRFLEVPVDATINVNEENLDKSKIFPSLLKVASSLNKYPNLTVFDVLRLALYSKSVTQTSVYEKKVSNNTTKQQIQTLISTFFQDQAINQENVSIEIINSTNTYGLGTRLANIITNMGGNVVMVSSSDKPDFKSRIVYSIPETYTVKRISEFLNLPKEKASKKGVADVIIIIGKDKESRVNF